MTLNFPNGKLTPAERQRQAERVQQADAIEERCGRRLDRMMAAQGHFRDGIAELLAAEAEGDALRQAFIAFTGRDLIDDPLAPDKVRGRLEAFIGGIDGAQRYFDVIKSYRRIEPKSVAPIMECQLVRPGDASDPFDATQFKVVIVGLSGQDGRVLLEIQNRVNKDEPRFLATFDADEHTGRTAGLEQRRRYRLLLDAPGSLLRPVRVRALPSHGQAAPTIVADDRTLVDLETEIVRRYLAELTTAASKAA